MVRSRQLVTTTVQLCSVVVSDSGDRQKGELGGSVICDMCGRGKRRVSFICSNVSTVGLEYGNIVFKTYICIRYLDIHLIPTAREKFRIQLVVSSPAKGCVIVSCRDHP